MVASWKGYDTNDSKKMNYFVIPGRLQLRYYNQCKKLGLNPHHDLKNLIEVRLSELGVNVKLEELYKLREDLEFQIKELEEHNNLAVVNKYLQKDVLDRVNAFRGFLHQNKLPPELNIYFVIKGLTAKYEMQYNDVTDVLKEHVIKEIKGDLKNKLLDRIEYVRMNSNNGVLTDEQAAEKFTKKAEA
jgi:hypothetical protein